MFTESDCCFISANFYGLPAPQIQLEEFQVEYLNRDLCPEFFDAADFHKQRSVHFFLLTVHGSTFLPQSFTPERQKLFVLVAWTETLFLEVLLSMSSC